MDSRYEARASPKHQPVRDNIVRTRLEQLEHTGTAGRIKA